MMADRNQILVKGNHESHGQMMSDKVTNGGPKWNVNLNKGSMQRPKSPLW